MLGTIFMFMGRETSWCPIPLVAAYPQAQHGSGILNSNMPNPSLGRFSLKENLCVTNIYNTDPYGYERVGETSYID